jgi:hypothetical protein
VTSVSGKRERERGVGSEIMVHGECEEETARVREETVASACHVLACPSDFRPGRGVRGAEQSAEQSTAARRAGPTRPVRRAAVRRRARASASSSTWARGHSQTGAGIACSVREALAWFTALSNSKFFHSLFVTSIFHRALNVDKK